MKRAMTLLVFVGAILLLVQDDILARGGGGGGREAEAVAVEAAGAQEEVAVECRPRPAVRQPWGAAAQCRGGSAAGGWRRCCSSAGGWRRRGSSTGDWRGRSWGQVLQPAPGLLPAK